MERPKTRFTPFVIYLVGFYAAWVGYVLWVYPWMQSLEGSTLRYALVNIGIRLLVWVLPVLLYLRYIDGVSPLVALKLKQNWRQGLLIGMILSGLIFLGSLLRYGLPHPDWHSLTWNSVLCTSILIGFIEEIPFRGFILQKFAERYGFWVANLISSALFLGIHLPGWISLHILRADTLITIFIFGMMMAVVFRYGKSLWGSIIAHSLNDFISSVLFRL